MSAIERRVSGLTVCVYQSFSFGRPPSLIPSFIDCGFPRDLDEYTNKDGGKEMGCKFHILSPYPHVTKSIYLPSVHTWTWQYTRLLHNVMTSAFGAKMPPYPAVLDLDRKIRDFPVPKYLQPICASIEDSPPRQELTMQRWIVLSSKEASKLIWTQSNEGPDA